MPAKSAKKIRDELHGYGVAKENVRIFGEENPKPDLQDYLTLNALRRKNRPAPDGVAEYQGRPLLYFVDEQRLTKSKPTQYLFDDEPDQIPTIFRQIACRGERVYLARVQFGRLLVTPVSPSEQRPEWTEYTPGSTDGRTLFSRLAFGITEGEDFAAGDVVFKKLFELLKHAANKIANDEVLRPDALSLVGRALFFRFLRDRGVLENYPVKNIAPKALDWTDCFLNPKNAADTCAWLDKTFNGDFLPLSESGSEAFFKRIDELTEGEIFRHLSAVVRGHQPSGNDYQPLIDWNWQTFDFAHIPVGLLSQVYEAFSWEWTPKEAKKTSQCYTPRNIAITLLDEAFDGLPNITDCRVLDPACGAGVFLVLAFRRLYLELWKQGNGAERPGTDAIRRVLENQLVGFDISEEALRLAALSLYLTAVELDPEPQPPNKLRFKNLRGHVLHSVREPGADKRGTALGSLGTHLGKRFDGKFDVVLSNPPWTSVDNSLGKKLENVCKEVIKKIDAPKAKVYRLPDQNPDLPFLWKAMEWCKSGGRIAMALPARILLKTAVTPSSARLSLFSLLQVDGIVNGTNLSDTHVWPDMNQPWILLFATNKRPPEGHMTRLITLPIEVQLNKTGQFRIDSESTRLIDPVAATKKPWLWKTLSIGTMLDVEVIEKILSAGGTPLNKYWKKVVGKHRNGKGYTRGKPEERTRDASHLKGLPNLSVKDAFKFVVSPEQLPTFGLDKAQWPRRSTIYDPPLALVKQSPGEERESGRAVLSFERVAYHETFNGYSACGHADGELLARYLHLFVHSNIWVYYLLATSPEFGAERRRSRKADLENCPIIPLESLKEDQRKELTRLSESLTVGTDIPWSDIDAFFATLYGLKAYDLQVVRDTLDVALPYDTARARACRAPTEAEKKAFIAVVKKTLVPFIPPRGGKLTVERLKLPSTNGRMGAPFEVLSLTTSNHTPANPDSVADGVLELIIQLAAETGSTQIFVEEDAGLVVGIYKHYRYWTGSRARLLCGEIIRNRLDKLTD
ncbi:HsdM family class I SAM-dependent methyltransferase [Zavarzinella formosa]|uniref:HsdM family class I SAM-dependent methyltransferase n=1 Tax=Zavarzinella formosa TaxID=360055 RepID=UPI00031B527E|nr:N-6 DNA methylase [Zavarzinella formosa]